jgi:hypothetical protein
MAGIKHEWRAYVVALTFSGPNAPLVADAVIAPNPHAARLPHRRAERLDPSC